MKQIQNSFGASCSLLELGFTLLYIVGNFSPWKRFKTIQWLDGSALQDGPIQSGNRDMVKLKNEEERSTKFKTALVRLGAS